MLLSPDEKTLYVALSNSDLVAAVTTASGKLSRFFSTTAPAQKYAGTYPTSLAQSSAHYLFVADSSLDAIAVFDLSQPIATSNVEISQEPLGFIPTDWYPSALTVHNDDLFIATAKGEGARANK